MIFNNPYWDNVDKHDLLAKWIVVHSYLYYSMDSPLVTDSMYDANCKQLVALRKEMDQSEIDECRWKKVMQGFDGSTGFHLYYKLNKKQKAEVATVAANLLKGRNKEWKWSKEQHAYQR